MSAGGAALGGAGGDSWGARDSAPVETGRAQYPGGGSDSRRGRGGFHYPIEVLEEFDVPAPVAEVIAELAPQQVEARTEVDYTAQLLAALDALGIEWRRQYDEALTAMREAYRQQQVALAVEAARQEDEYWGEAVPLLLLH